MYQLIFFFRVVRTILLALRDHFTVEDKAAIGYLDYPPQSRKELAEKSKNWKCKSCPYDAKDSGSSVTSKNEKVIDNSLLWNVGIILLIFSIIISYIYLKI